MRKNYYTRYVLYPDGSMEEIRVPKKEVEKHIDRLIKRDKEMLELLEKL